MCRLTSEKVPYFNGPIYLQNKTQVGKVEEIFGQIQSAFFTIKMAQGVAAGSYAEGDTFYTDPAKLLPLERFLPQPKCVTARHVTSRPIDRSHRLRGARAHSARSSGD